MLLLNSVFSTSQSLQRGGQLAINTMSEHSSLTVGNRGLVAPVELHYLLTVNVITRPTTFIHGSSPGKHWKSPDDEDGNTPPGSSSFTKLIQKSCIWFENSFSTDGRDSVPKMNSSSEAWKTERISHIRFSHLFPSIVKGLPPRVGSLPGINSVK